VNQAADPWSVRFRREREATWVELEKIVDQCERHGLRRLSAAQLARLPVLYRAALSALSVARSSVLDRSLLAYLEALVARAYLWVYAPRRGALALAAHYATTLFPAAVRAIRWHVAIAAAVLLLGAAIAFALFRVDADTYHYFVPSALAQGRDPGATTEHLRETLFAGGGDDDDLLTFAAFLFTHNASVAVLTYGLGFLFGVPALLLLLYTGLMLGAMTALYHDRDLAVEWWSWILPHGVSELLAICLCGGAALAVAQRLLFPGPHSRLHDLAALGRRMGGIVAGSIAMLLLAGLIEGVFRQTVPDLRVRYLLAGVTAACWLAYFTRVGRGRVAADGPTPAAGTPP
jgi:uncharacterized membrane protein SpoIIM required for sporulation